MNGGGAAAAQLMIFVAVLVFGALWLRAVFHRMRPRDLDTALPPDALRQLFEETVVAWGWNLEDDGNPMVARSSLLTGFQRQRIGLTVHGTTGGRTAATVEVISYEGQWLLKVPKSPYTVIWRIERFLAAVHQADPTAREVDDDA